MFHNIHDNHTSSSSNERQCFLQEEHVQLACSMFVDRDDTGGQQQRSEPSRLLQAYLRHRQVTSLSPSSWVAHNPQISCTLIDHEHDLLFIFGDTVGALPLWYELQFATDGLPPQVFVSSHPMLGTSLGFTQLTPVGPGLTLSMSMEREVSSNSHHVVLNCQHWSEIATREYLPVGIKEAKEIALELLETASSSMFSQIDGSVNGDQGIMTEFDLHDDSSVLLECALHQIVQTNLWMEQTPTRLRFNTQPLITDPHSKTLPKVISAQLYGMYASLILLLLTVLMIDFDCHYLMYVCSVVCPRQDQILAFHAGFKTDTLAWEAG
jgi:hypothetical protein